MEILSDTTFRGKASFASGFDVTGTSDTKFADTVKTIIGCLYLNTDKISTPYGTLKIGHYCIDGTTIATYKDLDSYFEAFENNQLYSGCFENPTIPSGCKIFSINGNTAKNRVGRMFVCSSEPYITQIRKVSNNELMDITISGFGVTGAPSEFVFTRSSTDEIPESYFKVSFIQLKSLSAYKY